MWASAVQGLGFSLAVQGLGFSLGFRYTWWTLWLLLVAVDGKTALSFNSVSQVSALGFSLTKLTKYIYTWYVGLKSQCPSIFPTVYFLYKVTK